MAKEKIDVVIDGMTFKDIQGSVSKDYEGNDRYYVDTAGVAQIMRQYIKNKYGDIKAWARSRSFAGGSSVDVYLWNVPDDWYRDIESFSEKFGQYQEPYSGWRGSNAEAKTTSGVKVRNTSPYMHVYNKPPYGSAEENMTPPDYSKSLPKKSSGSGYKKGFKKFGEKKTEGFTLVKSCGNGWNLFVKKDESDSPFTYRLVKDYAVTPVGKEQFYALKGDMLDVGFLWSVKAQCFEYNRFNEIPEATIKNACGVLTKYFPITESIPPTESTPPTESVPTTKVPIKSITLVDQYATYTTFKEVDDYFKFLYENESKLPKYGNDKYKIEFKWEDGSNITSRLDISKGGAKDFNPFRESLSDYYKKLTDGTKKYIPMYYNDLKTELKNLSFEDLAETKTTKIPIEYIRFGYATYLTFKEVEDYLKFFYENEDKLLRVKNGEDNYKIEFVWKDGSSITENLLVSAGGKDDFNPFNESLSNYYKKRANGTKEFTVYYEGKLNTSLENLSFEDLDKTQPTDSTQEVNLEQLISDMNILIDLETDNDKRMELAGYRNDLQILLSLNN